MAGYRDLPMGRHNAEALTTADALDAFEQFVEAKAGLLRLLRREAERDETMLGQMRGAIDASG
jgi:hypothetical protein